MVKIEVRFYKFDDLKRSPLIKQHNASAERAQPVATVKISSTSILHDMF
jgi:hypothetical protein